MLGQIGLEVNRPFFIHMSSFIPNHGDSSVPVEIIVTVFTAVIDQEIFLFGHKI